MSGKIYLFGEKKEWGKEKMEREKKRVFSKKNGGKENFVGAQ